MKKTLSSLSIAAGVSVALLSVSGIAQAGDCKNVKIKFINNLPSKVKVRKVEIKGDGGTWKEDIANKEIPTPGNYTTNGRRMNKLQSGKKPDWMKVEYDQLDAANGGWLKNKVMTFTNRKECFDNHTYVLDMK